MSFFGASATWRHFDRLNYKSCKQVFSDCSIVKTYYYWYKFHVDTFGRSKVIQLCNFCDSALQITQEAGGGKNVTIFVGQLSRTITGVNFRFIRCLVLKILRIYDLWPANCDLRPAFYTNRCVIYRPEPNFRYLVCKIHTWWRHNVNDVINHLLLSRPIISVSLVPIPTIWDINNETFIKISENLWIFSKFQAP